MEIETLLKKERNIDKNLPDLTISKKWQQVNLDDLLFFFVPSSLYPTARSHEGSVASKIETSFSSSKGMNDDIY